jgi:hypothetical protein
LHAPPGMPTDPGDRLDSAPARSGLRPRGPVCPGVGARSEVDARLAVVQVRPGGMPRAGQGHGNQRRDPSTDCPPPALHLLYGWWIGRCAGCGLTMAESRRQDRADRKANRRLCPVCHLDGA